LSRRVSAWPALRFCALIIIVPGSPIVLGFATTGALGVLKRNGIPWPPLVYNA
jgi:hypothetical protein